MLVFVLLGILLLLPLMVLLWIGDREGETHSQMQMQLVGSKHRGSSFVPEAVSHNPLDVVEGTIACVLAEDSKCHYHHLNNALWHVVG